MDKTVLKNKQKGDIISYEEEITRLLDEIKMILSRGNEAEIRRKGNGYIILEVKKKTKYYTTLSQLGHRKES